MTSTARRLARRSAAGVCVGVTVLAMSACGGSAPHSESSQAVTASHDSAWIDSAIALVGTESGHDPVVKVAINPEGAMITTRHADSRVQRQWWVAVDPHAIIAASPTPHSTATPTPLPTPTPTTPSPTRTRPASSTATPSATVSRPGQTRNASTSPSRSSTSPSRSSASPTPVFPVPSYAPATPAAVDKVDNSLGNMGLGAFGDTQVLPMWYRLQRGGCQGTNWTITATATWSGEVITRGTCDAQTVVQANGSRLPHNRDAIRNAAVQAVMLQNMATNEVSRVVINRVPVASCPTTLTADYVVDLDGPLQLRTTISCTDVTTVVLSNGWLPPNRIPTTSIKVAGIRDVERDLAAHYPAMAKASLRIEWSDLYNQAVYAPATSANGRPTYALDGTSLK